MSTPRPARALWEIVAAVVVGVALSVAAVLAASTAYAVAPEAGVSVTRVDPVGDGFWYQESFGPRLELTKPGFLIGATGKLSKRLRWHVDFEQSGTFRSFSKATMTDDAYDPKHHRCVHEEKCGPVAEFDGHGDFKGIRGALDLNVYGPVAVTAGLFTYRPTWYEDTDAYGVKGHYRNQTNARTAPVLGIVLHHGPVELRLEEALMCLSNRCVSGTLPPIWRNATTLSVTVRGW